MSPKTINELSHELIGAGIEVHRELGPGLLESAYEGAFSHELSLRNTPHVRQVIMPVIYKGVRIETGYRIDVLVEDRIAVELKAVEKLLPVHEAQLLTYLKLTGLRVGLIINFNVELLRNGVRRMLNG